MVEELEKVARKLIAMDNPVAYMDAFEVCRELEVLDSVKVEGTGRRDHGTIVYDEGNFRLAHELNRKIRAGANGLLRIGVDADEMQDLYYKTHLFDAPHFFDSFCIYIEKDRAIEKQFYLPRRKQLKRCADGIQMLEEGKLHTLNECQTSPGTANNDLPVMTYDFQAPLGEYGQAYPQYYMLRPLHLFMHDWGEALAPMEASFPAPQDLKKGEDGQLRWAIRSEESGSGFIFINNYERFCKLSEKKNVQLEACGVKLPKLTIPSGCMAIFPLNIDGIRYATAQLVARRKGKIYMMQIPGISTAISLQNGKTLKNVKPRGTEIPVYDNIYLITKAEAENLFLDNGSGLMAQVSRVQEVQEFNNFQFSILNCQFSKIKEAGPMRSIVKGKAKVAEAPSEEDWLQAAIYQITLPKDSSLFTLHSSLLSISYRGDCARLYAGDRLVADNFYYGRPFLFGLWRLPKGVRELELRILPLQPDAPIYLPQEADKSSGEQINKMEIYLDNR